MCSKAYCIALAATFALGAAHSVRASLDNSARLSSAAPETWFHIIDGNVTREGLSADIAAIADAGISGIQFFHGGWPQDELWPGVTNRITSMSENWMELVKFAESECHKHGLMFKMQNCPGWSMSGGPWISPERAMRKLVCFEPGKKPKFDASDDFREIGSVTFPLEASADVSVTFPNPHNICHKRSYEPDAELVLRDGGKEVFRTVCPRGAWQDVEGMTFRVPGISSAGVKVSFFAESPHYPTKPLGGSRIGEPRLDMWEAKAGWATAASRCPATPSP